MAEHRRYTKRQKVVAITSALASSVTAAAEAAAIPESTLRYWMDAPEFAELRTKTRAELAEGSMVLANLAQAELQRKMRAGEVDAKDLAVIYGIAIDKGQLLAGAATARTEINDITHALDDHERAALKQAIDAELAAKAEEHGGTAGDEAQPAVADAGA